MKGKDHLIFYRASVVHFLASRYIMDLRHIPESKGMAIQICRELLCTISSVFIYYTPELDIWLKGKDHLIFSRASVVHFRASRYITGLKHIPESKGMAIPICRGLPCWIWNISIYYALELDSRVKSNDHLNFSRASVVHFPASRYITGIDKFEWPLLLTGVYVWVPNGLYLSIGCPVQVHNIWIH